MNLFFIYIEVANRILSWQIWTPLSRLSYSTFLVHTMLIMFMYASEEHLIHIQSLNMVMNLCLFHKIPIDFKFFSLVL